MTSPSDDTALDDISSDDTEPEDLASDEPVAAQVRRLRPTTRRTTGRERHDEKITVYVSSEELVAIEQARLVLRAEHGIAVDRGRLVRESVAQLLCDLDNCGNESMLVRRLRSS